MNLKAIRESKNLTQDNLAEALGVSRTTVTMWETGKSMPLAHKLPLLASLLGVTVDELLKGVNE